MYLFSYLELTSMLNLMLCCSINFAAYWETRLLIMI